MTSSAGRRPVARVFAASADPTAPIICSCRTEHGMGVRPDLPPREPGADNVAARAHGRGSHADPLPLLRRHSVRLSTPAMLAAVDRALAGSGPAASVSRPHAGPGRRRSLVRPAGLRDRTPPDLALPT